jgi:DNA replicative helicase MCM subunit Mcm2 (Cdc46/Mcm family)
MSEPKTRYEISSDELNNRMERQARYHEEPVQRAVAVLEAALDSVMKKLGVDVDQDPENIQMQMDNLGIDVRSIDDPSMPKACGFYVFLIRGSDITPYAWIGDARLDQMGQCWCDIQWFREERLSETGGIKLL